MRVFSEFCERLINRMGKVCIEVCQRYNCSTMCHIVPGHYNDYLSNFIWNQNINHCHPICFKLLHSNRYCVKLSEDQLEIGMSAKVSKFQPNFEKARQTL